MLKFFLTLFFCGDKRCLFSAAGVEEKKTYSLHIDEKFPGKHGKNRGFRRIHTDGLTPLGARGCPHRLLITKKNGPWEDLSRARHFFKTPAFPCCKNSCAGKKAVSNFFSLLSESKIGFLDMRVVHEFFCLSFFYDPPVFKHVPPVAHVECMPYVLLQQ